MRQLRLRLDTCGMRGRCLVRLGRDLIAIACRGTMMFAWARFNSGIGGNSGRHCGWTESILRHCGRWCGFRTWHFRRCFIWRRWRRTAGLWSLRLNAGKRRIDWRRRRHLRRSRFCVSFR